MIAHIAVLAILAATGPKQDAAWTPKEKRADAVRVLVVTGGHEHDPEFYSVFDRDDVKAKIDPHPRGLLRDIRPKADVLVLYDILPEIDDARRTTLKDFVESGKGLLVLHHAICSAKDWPFWYQEVVGGRWFYEPLEGHPASLWKNNQDMRVTIARPHAITRGLRPFRILDEAYKGLWISPNVEVLLETDHPLSDGPLAWVSPYPKARVVYLQLGHGRTANLNPNWQRLVHNAILWVAHRLD